MSNENEADESSVLRDEIASLCRIVKEPGKSEVTPLFCRHRPISSPDCSFLVCFDINLFVLIVSLFDCVGFVFVFNGWCALCVAVRASAVFGAVSEDRERGCR